MKNFTELKKLLALTLILVPMVAIHAADGVEEVYNSRPLDVDGSFQEEEGMSDKLAKQRRDLEEKTNQKTLEKIENMRTAEEIKISKKINAALEGQLKAVSEIDEVSVAQASTQKVEAPAAVVVAPIIVEKTTRIIPYIGFTNYSKENVDYNSKVDGGLIIESKVSDHFALGLGFSYTKMSLFDSQNAHGGNYSGYGFNSYSPYVGQPQCFNNGSGVNCVNYNEREIDFNRMQIELLGKFFIISTGKLRPYIGGGLGYGRNELQYNDNGKGMYYYYNNQNNQLGGEGHTAYSSLGSVMLGSDLNFTDSVGLNINLKYAKGLTQGDNQQSVANTSVYNPDLIRLENIGREIEKASATSINVGLLVAF